MAAMTRFSSALSRRKLSRSRPSRRQEEGKRNLEFENLWGLYKGQENSPLCWCLFTSTPSCIWIYLFLSVLCRLQMVEFWFLKRWCFLKLGAGSVLMIYPVKKSLCTCALQHFTAGELPTQELWQILHPISCAPVQIACKILQHARYKNIINFLIPRDLHFTSACGFTQRYFSMSANCNVWYFEYGIQFENNILCEQMCSE